jgi:hypothetical protein
MLPMLLLLLLGTCSPGVKVTIGVGSWDYVEWRSAAYGVDTVWVSCQPFRDISYVELMIDGVVVGVDTFPGPQSDFEWDVRQLPEASMHILQARAISGSREYLSREDSVLVGFRSRLVVDGVGKTFSVYRPDGKLEASFEPMEGAYPSYPRFRAGCHSVVFIADRKLYEAPWASNQAELLDQVTNGIYSCDASPVSNLVAFEAYPAATAHLFIKDGTGAKVQITHDGDIAYIDSSRFTCTTNSGPVFSPDGDRLAYYRESKCTVPGDPHEGEMRRDAFVVDRYGTNPVNLTAGVDNAYFSGFTWTFDGKWVLFRVGTGPTPDGVVAANMSGHAITGLNIGAVAMACSPDDSTLAYVGLDLEHRLYTMKLVWTDDTLYVVGPGMPLGGDDYAQRSYIDWVKYSKQ